MSLTERMQFLLCMFQILNKHYFACLSNEFIILLGCIYFETPTYI